MARDCAVILGAEEPRRSQGARVRMGMRQQRQGTGKARPSQGTEKGEGRGSGQKEQCTHPPDVRLRGRLLGATPYPSSPSLETMFTSAHGYLK